MSDIKVHVATSWPDELKFVDEDIRKEFENKNYMHGVPTQVQLAKTMRDLIYILKTVVYVLEKE